MQTKIIMNENDKLLPFLKKAQKLQIKYFGKVSLWVDSSNNDFFVVVIFLKDSNKTVGFYPNSNVEELNINYNTLLALIKEANEEV